MVQALVQQGRSAAAVVGRSVVGVSVRAGGANAALDRTTSIDPVVKSGEAYGPRVSVDASLRSQPVYYGQSYRLFLYILSCNITQSDSKHSLLHCQFGDFNFFLLAPL